MGIPATGIKLKLSALNVDGVSNGLLDDGIDLPKWVPSAGVCAAFTVVDTSNGLVRRKPKFKANTLNEAVVFDGVLNLLTSVGSGAALDFVPKTGTFDLLIVPRKVATSIGVQRRLIGNAGNGSDGLLVSIGDSTLGAEGLVRVVFRSAGTVTTLLSSREILIPVATPYPLLVRGDGSKLSVSHDLVNFESIPYAAGPSISAAPTDDWSVGGGQFDDMNCFGGDLISDEAVVLIDHNWTDAELAQIKAQLVADIGEGVV